MSKVRPYSRRDITGQKFGQLTAIERVGYYRDTRISNWSFRCDCGNITHVNLSNLKHTRSCGCISRDAEQIPYRENRTAETLGKGLTKHGDTAFDPSNRTIEYVAWTNMKTRCYNPKFIGWIYYGGRGEVGLTPIEVCEKWRNSFEDFLADMGRRPEGMSLDREDPDGNYGPDNCRWATDKEQANNRSAKLKEAIAAYKKRGLL